MDRPRLSDVPASLDSRGTNNQKPDNGTENTICRIPEKKELLNMVDDGEVPPTSTSDLNITNCENSEKMEKMVVDDGEVPPTSTNGRSTPPKKMKEKVVDDGEVPSTPTNGRFTPPKKMEENVVDDGGVPSTLTNGRFTPPKKIEEKVVDDAEVPFTSTNGRFAPPKKMEEKTSTKRIEPPSGELASDEPASKRKAQGTVDPPEQYASDQNDLFHAQYIQDECIGRGGFGKVFAGFRKTDNFPVAIKHVAKTKVLFNYHDKDRWELSAEVEMLLKLEASGVNPGILRFLDWFELSSKLVLVMERPLCAVNLSMYAEVHCGIVPENKSKVLLKQLVEVAIHLQILNIFHRDIKLENILIQTDSDVPQLRLIDFGVSCFFNEKSNFTRFHGTEVYAPPEWIQSSFYCAIPTTVWQIGIVLFEIKHFAQFDSKKYLGGYLRLGRMPSKECKDFLKRCLTKDYLFRPNLQDLINHKWIL